MIRDLILSVLLQILRPGFALPEIKVTIEDFGVSNGVSITASFYYLFPDFLEIWRIRKAFRAFEKEHSNLTCSVSLKKVFCPKFIRRELGLSFFTTDSLLDAEFRLLPMAGSFRIIKVREFNPAECSVYASKIKGQIA